MIVVSPAVEPNQLVLHQHLDLMGFRIDHPLALVVSRKLPVHQDQVREYLDIKEHEPIILVGRHRFRNIRALELHQRHPRQAVVRLMAGVDREVHDVRLHVGNIIMQPLIVGVVKDLLDEVDAWLRPRMDLFAQVPFDQIAQPFLTAHAVKIKRTLCLLSRQAATQMRNRQVIAPAYPPPQTRIPAEGLDLDIRLVHICQSCNITVPDVVQVQPVSPFRHFRVGRFPGRSRLQIERQALLAVLVLLVEVDHDVLQRRPDIMGFAGVNITEPGSYVRPLLAWFVIFICVLGRLRGEDLVKK